MYDTAPIPEKYGLNPANHVFAGDDLSWSGDNLDRIKAEAILHKAVVVGVETYPMRGPDPAFCGVVYTDGFAFHMVVLRMAEVDPMLRYSAEKDSFLTAEGVPTTRRNRLTQWWATIYCSGTKELNEVLAKAWHHPDDEEENR